MKTFNIMRLLVVVVLCMSVQAANVLASCGTRCNTSCAPRCETKCAPCPGKACTLQPQQVEIVKTCDHPGYYRQVCRLEYRPCEGKVTRYKACPIFEGCFAEDGQPLDNSARATGGAGYEGEAVAFTQEVGVTVTPVAKSNNFRKARVSRSAKKNFAKDEIKA